MRTRERVFPNRKELTTMSALDQLITYVSNLNPEQINKLVNHIPLLTSLLEEQAPPYLPEQTSQNP